MHHGLKRDKTGVNTVEGTVAGSRAAALTRAREEESAKYEAKKQKIQDDHARGVGRIDDKFDKRALTAESAFQKKTVGLVTAADFRRLRDEVKKSEDETKREEATPAAAPTAPDKPAVARESATAKKKKAVAKKAALSFSMEDEDEEDEAPKPKRKALKCPHVDTAFLPDRDRDAERKARALELRNEWQDLQERVKAESVDLAYSYYDGKGHRRRLVAKKGDTIGSFLHAAHRQLVAEFPEVRSSSADSLIFVKEDLMLPHHYSFYDLILSKARGRTRQLFHFTLETTSKLKHIFDGVNSPLAPPDDGAPPSDPSTHPLERDESKPGKIVLRAWYERNKHIFPASRWEVYDPAVDYASRTLQHPDNPNSLR